MRLKIMPASSLLHMKDSRGRRRRILRAWERCLDLKAAFCCADFSGDCNYSALDSNNTAFIIVNPVVRGTGQRHAHPRNICFHNPLLSVINSNVPVNI